MVYERAEFTIEDGREEEFERVFEEQAKQVIAQAQGFVSVSVARAVERPNVYLLLIVWETLEDHTERFRGSELYARWSSLLHPFFAAPAVVEHYTPR